MRVAEAIGRQRGADKRLIGLGMYSAGEHEDLLGKSDFSIPQTSMRSRLSAVDLPDAQFDWLTHMNSVKLLCVVV